MASTKKVTNIDTPDNTGNIIVDRPLSGSGASLTNLPAANLTGTIDGARFPATLPASDGSALTNIVHTPADNSVTASKIDLSITQGDLIYGTGTDTWTKLAKGTAAQLLTMNAGATAPEWAAAPGGAKFTPLAQIPSSNLGVVEFDSTWITSTYDVYFIAMIGIVPAGDAGAIQAWVQQGGSRAGGTNYEYGYDGFKSSGSSSTGYNTGRSHWEIIEKVGYGSGESMSGGMWLWEPLAAGRYTTLTWQVGGYSSIPDVRVATGAGVYKSGTAVNGIEFTSSAGNFAGGQWRLYGVEKT